MHNIKLFILLFLLLFANIAISQPVFLRVEKMGAVNDGVGNQIATDKNGNTFTVGNFTGTIDVDPSVGVTNLTTSLASVSGFIQKLDSNNNLIWAKQFGTNNSGTLINEVHIDKSNNLILMGNFYTNTDTLDLDPGTAVYNVVSGTNGSYFILKLNSNGDFIWAKTFDENSVNSNINQFKIATDYLNNIIITGGFTDTIDTDPSNAVVNNIISTSINYTSDIFIEKLDSNGNFVWVKQMKSNINAIGNNQGMGIKTDAHGNIYTIGTYSDSVDINPSLGIQYLVSQTKEMYFLKLDADGNFIWAKSLEKVSIGNHLGIDAIAMALDMNNNILATGFSHDSIDYDPGIGTAINYKSGIFIEKIDSNGNFVWVKMLETNRNGNLSSDINIDLQGNVYTSGVINDSLDFDPSLSNYVINPKNNGSLFFLQKLDRLGNFIWVVSTSNPTIFANGTIPNSTALNFYNHRIYTTGRFIGTVDFDPSLSNSNTLNNPSSYNDIFIQTLICYPTYDTIIKKRYGPYTLNGITYDTSGTYNQYLNNHYGCDSIIVIKLTISPFGINDISNSYKINIFPNPVANTLTVQSDFSINKIELTNIVGQHINVPLKLMATNIYQIDVSEITIGFYILKTYDFNGNTYTSKFIKD